MFEALWIFGSVAASWLIFLFLRLFVSNEYKKYKKKTRSWL